MHRRNSRLISEIYHHRNKTPRFWHGERMKPFGLKIEKESVNLVLNEIGSSEGRRDDGMVFGLEESEY